MRPQADLVILSGSDGSLRVHPIGRARRDPSLPLRMTKGAVRLTGAALLVLVAILATTLVAAPSVSAQDVYSEKTLEISRKLSCPVCAGQTVAESNSPIARQMRSTIEQKVQAGESERQIIDFFVARYGDSIVTEPPKSGFSLGLWWMPVVVVVLAATVVALFVRERTRTAAVTAGENSDTSATDDELEAIAREVLGSSGDERMSRA